MTDTINYKTEKVDDVMILLKRIDKATIEKPPFTKPHGIQFLGTVNDYNFTLKTFTTPPAELNFKVKGSALHLAMKINDNNQLKGFAMFWAIIMGFIAVLFLFVGEATIVDRLIFLGVALVFIVFILLIEKGILKIMEPSDKYLKRLVERIIKVKLN